MKIYHRTDSMPMSLQFIKEFDNNLKITGQKSLTTVVCIIMEAIARDDTVRHMTENGLLADQQHGFVPNRSCMIQMLLCVEEWKKL